MSRLVVLALLLLIDSAFATCVYEDYGAVLGPFSVSPLDTESFVFGTVYNITQLSIYAEDNVTGAPIAFNYSITDASGLIESGKNVPGCFGAPKNYYHLYPVVVLAVTCTSRTFSCIFAINLWPDICTRNCTGGSGSGNGCGGTCESEYPQTPSPPPGEEPSLPLQESESSRDGAELTAAEEAAIGVGVFFFVAGLGVVLFGVHPVSFFSRKRQEKEVPLALQ